jgi:BirA family transcriptional regulator, biotin operon repressor / biotin---[acetyl-CoA-carboxylase] ligase
MNQLASAEKKRKIIALKETSSTNAEALTLAREGSPHGTVVVAGRQTKGRGRYGRSWESPSGNLYMSILVRPDVVLHERAPELSFVAAVACRDALSEAGVPGVQLKWPNDLLIKGRKFGGLLLEREAESGAVVIGIGINLLHYPADALFPATSLHTEGFEMEAEELMHLILPDFERRYDEWHMGNFEEIRQSWLQHAANKKGRISLRLPDRTVEGEFEGMAEDGALLLKVDGKVQKFLAGDVMFGEG